MTAYNFITNASIESATIDIERGFVLTGWLHLNFKGGSQGFGGKPMPADLDITEFPA